MLKFAVSDPPVPLNHPPSHGQNQGHGKVGRRIGQHAGGIGDQDAPAGCRGHIDIIVPDTIIGHDFKMLRSVYDVRINGVGNGADQPLASSGIDRQLPVIQRTIGEMAFDMVRFRNALDNVIRKPAGDKNVHRHFTDIPFCEYYPQTSRG